MHGPDAAAHAQRAGAGPKPSGLARRWRRPCAMRGRVRRTRPRWRSPPKWPRAMADSSLGKGLPFLLPERCQEDADPTRLFPPAAVSPLHVEGDNGLRSDCFLLKVSKNASSLACYYWVAIFVTYVRATLTPDPVHYLLGTPLSGGVICERSDAVAAHTGAGL